MKEMIKRKTEIDTPLGPMIAIADEKFLYLLEFLDHKRLGKRLEKFKIKTKSTILPGYTDPIKSIERELKLYFDGKLKEFKTPLFLLGSDFQKLAWEALIKVPYGETRSYSDQASHIGNSRAFRAVANANGANKLAIIIPCHRIINNNGALGGYGSGIDRKKFLLNHEKNYGKN